MPNYKFIVLSRAVEGREDEYNDWYQNTHLREIVGIPGVVGAQRFRLAQQLSGEAPAQYLAIYELESEDLQGFVMEMLRRAGSGEITVSPAMVENPQAVIYEEFGARVTP